MPELLGCGEQLDRSKCIKAEVSKKEWQEQGRRFTHHAYWLCGEKYGDMYNNFYHHVLLCRDCAIRLGYIW